jgi:hypothetical protein
MPRRRNSALSRALRRAIVDEHLTARVIERELVRQRRQVIFHPLQAAPILHAAEPQQHVIQEQRVDLVSHAAEQPRRIVLHERELPDAVPEVEENRQYRQLYIAIHPSTAVETIGNSSSRTSVAQHAAAIAHGLSTAKRVSNKEIVRVPDDDTLQVAFDDDLSPDV